MRSRWYFKPSFHWLNRVLILMAATVVSVAAWQGFRTLESIPVQRIVVTGALQHTQTEAVQEMVQPALAGGFLNADLEQVREQLEALPWIYRASVRRRWPNALEIDVLEQLPIARWGEEGFLNHEGEIFQSTNADSWQTLPQLIGPTGAQNDLMVRYQQLADMLQPAGLDVLTLQVDSRGQLSAGLEGGINLVLGGRDFEERVQRFITVYHADLAVRSDDIERVDMRYQTGLAVAFRGTGRETEQLAGLDGK